jgi:hypothetical protein
MLDSVPMARIRLFGGVNATTDRGEPLVVGSARFARDCASSSR